MDSGVLGDEAADVSALLAGHHTMQDFVAQTAGVDIWFRRNKGPIKDLCNHTFKGTRNEWNRPEGHGNCEFDDKGDMYEGDFVNGTAHGSATITFSNGDVYTGAVKHLHGEEAEDAHAMGHMHGHGEYDFKNGDHYDGQWAFGKRTGSGFLMLAKGDSYEGEWLLDKFNGRGKYVFDVGGTYEGQFVDGRRHGKGTYSFPNGSKLAGEFSNGRQVGVGTLTYPAGDQLTSEFKDGLPIGKGFIKRVNGQIWLAHNGQIVERVK